MKLILLKKIYEVQSFLLVNLIFVLQKLICIINKFRQFQCNTKKDDFSM